MKEMSKEQTRSNTPITADYIKKEILKGLSEVFRGKTIYMKDIEVSIEQYAKAKVLEALEREFSKVDISMFDEDRYSDYTERGQFYYETEVKPKYE